MGSAVISAEKGKLKGELVLNPPDCLLLQGDWVDVGGAVYVFYLDFRKALDTVFRNTLIGKMNKNGLDEWMVEVE